MKPIDLMKKIFDYPRSLIGAGVNQTIDELNKYTENSFNYEDFYTGEKCGDWVVPKEWVFESIEIIDLDKGLCVFKSKNQMNVVIHSIPIDIKISRYDLASKCYTRESLPDATPYVTSYYKNDWGVCLPYNLLRTFNGDNYRVIIKSSFRDSYMRVATAKVTGLKKSEVLFSSYVCHPAMANNELSGPILTVMLINFLKEKKRIFSYRLLLYPETIGPIFYINKYIENLKGKVLFAFNLTCVGDERSYSWLPSKYGNSLSDKIVKKVMEDYQVDYIKYSWLDRGSDERQYCAPNVDLGMTSLMRSKFGEYIEYHTDKDNIGNVVTENGINQTFEIYKRIIENIEMYSIPKIRFLGEPMLQKYDLYTNLNNGKIGQNVKNIKNVISYSDGVNDSIDIANLCGLTHLSVCQIINVLEENKIIYKVGLYE